MLSARILTVLLGAPLLVAAIWLGGVPLRLLLALIGGLAARELAALLLDPADRAGSLLPFAVIALILSTTSAPNGALPAAWGGVALAFVIFAGARRLIGRRRPSAAATLPFMVFSLVYVGVSLAYILLLRALPDGLRWTLFLFVVTWATDTGAYATGRFFGRHPLAPAISPNKSIEGAVGGLVFAAIVGALFAQLPSWPLGALWATPVFAVILSAFVQLGDLFESALKREAGVKDSGSLLPGHGGLLDRFDGLLWSAPAGYYLTVAAAWYSHLPS